MKPLNSIRFNPTTASVIKTLQQNPGLCALLIFIIVSLVGVGLLPPQLLRHLIDRHLVTGRMGGLGTLALIYFGLLLLIGLLDFSKEVLLLLLGQRITTAIRLQLMAKLGCLKGDYFSANGAGTILSRFTNDVDVINDLFTGGILGMVIDCLKILGILGSICFFSLPLGLITLLLLPLIYQITRHFQKRMLQAQMKNRILTGKVNHHISETLENLRMIQVGNKEAYMEQQYRRYLADNFQTVEKVNFYDSLYAPLIQLLRAFSISLVIFLSSQPLNFIGISLGMVAAAVDLMAGLFTPVENLGMELQSIQQALSGLQRVNQFCQEPEEPPKNPHFTAARVIPQPSQLHLAFRDLSFGYTEKTPILRNLSLEISAGEKVTFVGRTGVGKSTLFKLIMGLLPPSSGTITLNGFPVYQIPNHEKRQIFGYVEQCFLFIKGTIAQQISLQDPDISMFAIRQAMDFVGLDSYVMTLPQGYDTPVVSDQLFSQGQQQLLGIARALVCHPPLLLLDEITANLDSLTEKRILKVLERVGADHTVLAISHRQSAMLHGHRMIRLE